MTPLGWLFIIAILAFSGSLWIIALNMQLAANRLRMYGTAWHRRIERRDMAITLGTLLFFCAVVGLALGVFVL